ncbi:MAG: hypothetical protein QOC81_1717 [Thermoanaerobaculia bacterium]|jgi:uncharacterized protein (UPF0332 family)|nr:hypothetical protein [Thermoanaerobaculia bacterium]
MSFDWSDFLPLAEDLTAAGPDANREAYLRTAISRAYYAAFGVGRQRARGARLATRRSAAEHGEIAAFYTKQYGETGEKIAITLGRLRNRRNAADYDDDFVDIEDICLLSIEDARDLLRILATL